jgi:hypothetical protein
MKKVHPNGQLSLGKEWGGREVAVEYVSPHEVRIRAGTIAFIPEEHHPFFTPAAIERLSAFSDWEEKTPPKKADLDQFRAAVARRRTAKPKKK